MAGTRKDGRIHEGIRRTYHMGGFKALRYKFLDFSYRPVGGRRLGSGRGGAGIRSCFGQLRIGLHATIKMEDLREDMPLG